MKAEYFDGNRLQLLVTGSEYFPALEAAIRAAKRDGWSLELIGNQVGLTKMRISQIVRLPAN